MTALDEIIHNLRTDKTASQHAANELDLPTNFGDLNTLYREAIQDPDYWDI